MLLVDSTVHRLLLLIIGGFYLLLCDRGSLPLVSHSKIMIFCDLGGRRYDPRSLYPGTIARC